MANMISELMVASHVLTDEQQLQAVIRSLPRSWEHMRVNLTHNDNIKTFDDVAHHVELEENRLGSEKGIGEAYMASSSKGQKKGSKRAKSGKGCSSKFGTDDASSSDKNKKQQCGKHAGAKRRDRSKVVCYNYNQLGHFACECTQQKVCSSLDISTVYISICCMLVERFSIWACRFSRNRPHSESQMVFVGYHRIPANSKCIHMGNNRSVEIQGIGTCELVFRNGHKLLLHDVLYAPNIRHRLVSLLIFC
jgi:hypothetical protein